MMYSLVLPIAEYIKKNKADLLIRHFHIIPNVNKAKGDLKLIFRLAGVRAATSRNGKAADAGKEANQGADGYS